MLNFTPITPEKNLPKSRKNVLKRAKEDLREILGRA
jgi:hypothetical protein